MEDFGSLRSITALRKRIAKEISAIEIVIIVKKKKKQIFNILVCVVIVHQIQNPMTDFLPTIIWKCDEYK